MAKVVITIKDPQDGEFVKVEFVPPLRPDQAGLLKQKPTPAQALGMGVLDFIRRSLGEPGKRSG